MNQQYVLDSSIDSRNIMQLLNDSSFAMDPVSVLPSTSDQQHQSMHLHFDDVQSTSTSKFSLPLSQHMQPFNIASSVSVSSGAPSSSSSVTVTGAVAQSKTSVSSNKRDRQELNKKKKQNVTTTKKQLQQHKLQQAAFNATKHEAISMAIAKQEEEKTILLPQVEGITTSQPAIVNPGKEIDVAVNEFPLNSVVSSSSSMYGVGELEIVNDEWKYKDNDYFNFEFIVAVKEQRRIGSARSGKKSTPQASSITVRARGPCVPKSAALKATLFNFGAAVDNKRRLVNPDNSNGSPLVELRKGIDIGCADNIALFSPTADKYGWRYATMKCCITRGARVQCRKNHIALKLEVIDVDENHIEIPKNYEYIQSANDSDSDDVEACDEPTKKKRSKIRLTLPNAVPVQAFPWIRTARISVSEKAMCPRECDKRRLLEQAMKERTKLTNMNFPIFDRVQTPSHPFMQQYNSEPNETQGAFFNELNFNNSNFINIQSNNDEDGKNKRRKLDRIMSGRDLMVSPSIKIAKQKKESTTDSPPTAIAILSMPDVNFPAQFGVGPSAESASKPLTIADKSHRFTRNSFADLDELGVPNVDASELLANLMARRQSYAFPPFQDQQQSYPTSMASNVYNQSHAFSANKSNFPAPAIELGSRMNGLRRLSIQIPDQFQSNIQNQIIPTGLDSSLVDRRISDIFEHQTFPSSAPPILFGRSSLFINEQGNEVSIVRSPLVAPQQANINMEGNSFQMLPSELSFLLQQDDESF